jgi:polyphenol oxidase
MMTLPSTHQHSWQWQTWQDRPYLTCDLLAAWPHGFFTRQFSPQGPAELVQALHPTASAYWVKQVHGNQLLSSSQITNQITNQITGTSSPQPEADGVYSDAPQQAVWSCTADCTPVLLADQASGRVAAIHAGWRGTAAQIVPIAVQTLQAQGSQIGDLRVAMGPAISGQMYQVSTAVAAIVGHSLTPQANSLVTQDPNALTPAQVEAIIEHLWHYPQPPISPDHKPGHVRLDVRQVIALQLANLNLQPTQIAIAPHCTYQDAENFYSYRRESRRQVQWSGIISQG